MVKQVTTTPLPEIQGDAQSITLSERKNGDGISDHYLSKYYTLIKEIENDMSITLKVPQRLSNPDKLIIAAKKELTDPKINESYYHKGIISTSFKSISISVSKNNVPRALRFMDSLIKLLKYRGHNLIVKNNKTYALVYDEEINIRCREKLKRVYVDQGTWQHSELHANGILSFRLDDYSSSKEWSDTKKESLEDQLSKILTKLELHSKNIKKDREERKAWNRKYELEKQKLEELRMLKEEELSKFKDLINSAKRYEEVTQIKNYIKAVELNAHKNNSMSYETIDWIKWANKKADWYDPIIGEEDELLGDYI